MRRRGFTMVELIIGMVITAMILCALAAVSFAVSTNWQQATAVDSSFITGNQAQSRLTQYLRPATAVGACVNGDLSNVTASAALFFWMGDVTSGTYPNGDGKIEFNEIGLLAYDSGSQQLRLYYASDWATWSTAAQNAANALAGTSSINNSANMGDFESACPNYRILMRNVTACTIDTVTTASRPLVEYVIKLRDTSGTISTHYGTVTLRAPVTASN